MKRKKYDRMARLRRLATGAVLRFNGDEDAEQVCSTAAGIPISRPMFEYVISHPFRWDISVRFVYTHGELVKVVERSAATEQTLRLDDLSDIVAEWQTAAALELGDYWAFKRKEWEARVLP